MELHISSYRRVVHYLCINKSYLSNQIHSVTLASYSHTHHYWLPEPLNIKDYFICLKRSEVTKTQRISIGNITSASRGLCHQKELVLLTPAS